MEFDNELVYPEIFSNEFVSNIENVKMTLITQETNVHNYKRPTHVVMHFHSGYELFLCKKGCLYVMVCDEKISLHDGEMLIVSPSVSHAMMGTEPGSSIHSIYFNIEQNGKKGTLDLYKIISKIIDGNYVKIPGLIELSDILTNIREKCEEKDIFALSTLCHQFLMGLVRLTGAAHHIYNGATSDNSNLRIHKIHTLLHSRFREDITISDLADNLHLSSRQVSRIIKEKFGCTFKELLTKIRMQMAGEMLLRSDDNVSKIASQVGYSSVRGFYSAFRSHFGCLPKEYKKKSK